MTKYQPKQLSKTKFAKQVNAEIFKSIIDFCRIYLATYNKEKL